jgi:uncharacterized protein YqhQ
MSDDISVSEGNKAVRSDHNVGGQAVIEGVMMKSPSRIAIAVRSPGGEIILREKPFVSLTKRYRILNLPVVRGAVTLFEMLAAGIRALKFSADIAAAGTSPHDTHTEENRTGEKATEFRESKFSNVTMIFLIGIALGTGILVFFYIPLWLTSFFRLEHNGLLFNLIDGMIRILFFLSYLVAISMMKDIRRIFEYHGAEHKTIFAWESGEELSVENSRKYRTLHPRCGTSFLMVVFIVAFLMHLVTDIVFQLITGTPPNFQQRFCLHLPLLPIVAGVAYETIRAAGKRENWFLRLFVSPGMMLQRITTREPSEDQIEVAIRALKSALGKE